MLARAKWIFIVVFASFSFDLYAAQPLQAFAGSEHITMGDAVKLHFTLNDAGVAGLPLHLPNGLLVTYGEALAFGDQFEIINKPISLGEDNVEQTNRFIEALNSFAKDPNVLSEANEIIKIVRNEQQMLIDAVKQGQDPEVFYQKVGYETEIKLNCATGGGCNKSTWLSDQGRTLKLAEKDYDHFGNNAWIAYSIGHQVAMQIALKANELNKPELLEFAYAANAFASHFISDRFAAGHIRTLRIELPEKVSPWIVGTVLVHYMHDEENQFGLHVHNGKGDHWVCYGDHSYYSPKNGENIRLLLRALQASADEIFETYLTGKMSTESIEDYLPIADEVNNNANQDIAALFYSDGKTVLRRKDLKNPYDNEWTNDWWGWSTLVELHKERGLRPEDQALLSCMMRKMKRDR